MDDALVLSFVRELSKPLYAERMGRPSLDPVVFFKCSLIGFFESFGGMRRMSGRRREIAVQKRMEIALRTAGYPSV